MNIHPKGVKASADASVAHHGIPLRPRYREKVYVRVISDCDSTGYIRPMSITWRDGRTFAIDDIKDIRPAEKFRHGAEGVCYVVMIHGEEKRLFFEKVDSAYTNRIARWYVEAVV